MQWQAAPRYEAATLQAEKARNTTASTIVEAVQRALHPAPGAELRVLTTECRRRSRCP